MQTFLNFFFSWPVYVYLLCSATSVVFGDYFAKLWSVSRHPWQIGLAIILYLFSGLFYFPSLLKEQLVVASIIYTFLSIVGFMFIGFVVFKETFNLTQIVGIIFGLVSLTILTVAAR
jgi:multidrug transporter EmrE-like cation transporter